MWGERHIVGDSVRYGRPRPALQMRPSGRRPDRRSGRVRQCSSGRLSLWGRYAEELGRNEPSLPDRSVEERRDMFERFTDRARRVVVLAQEEARMLNHNYIGTEHILLGLIHEGEGVAAKALERDRKSTRLNSSHVSI